MARPERWSVVPVGRPRKLWHRIGARWDAGGAGGARSEPRAPTVFIKKICRRKKRPQRLHYLYFLIYSSHSTGRWVVEGGCVPTALIIGKLVLTVVPTPKLVRGVCVDPSFFFFFFSSSFPPSSDAGPLREPGRDRRGTDAANVRGGPPGPAGHAWTRGIQNCHAQRLGPKPVPRRRKALAPDHGIPPLPPKRSYPVLTVGSAFLAIYTS